MHIRAGVCVSWTFYWGQNKSNTIFPIKLFLCTRVKVWKWAQCRHSQTPAMHKLLCRFQFTYVYGDLFRDPGYGDSWWILFGNLQMSLLLLLIDCSVHFFYTMLVSDWEFFSFATWYVEEFCNLPLILMVISTFAFLKLKFYYSLVGSHLEVLCYYHQISLKRLFYSHLICIY